MRRVVRLPRGHVVSFSSMKSCTCLHGLLADLIYQYGLPRSQRGPITKASTTTSEGPDPPGRAILRSGQLPNGEGGAEDTGASGWKTASTKMIEGCATAFGSILILGIAGYSYNAYYKSHVLRKMENAFAVGYSSVELAALSRHVDSEGSHAELFQTENFEDADWIPRDDQAIIDRIVDGTMCGQ